MCCSGRWLWCNARSAPVSAGYGSQDVLYRGKLAELFAALQLTPDFRRFTLLEKVGHWAQYRQPEAFINALLAALATGIELVRVPA